jgi:tRNA(His) 5'-end guanylyltransferase
MASSKGRSPSNRPGYPKGIRIDWKARESENERAVFTVDGYIGVRCDGRAFHTYTRKAERPFDSRIRDAMEAGTRACMESVPGCVLGYFQSDEASIFIANKSVLRHESHGGAAEGLPFGGRIEKLVSVTASAMTAGFLSSISQTDYPAPCLPSFDSRVFSIGDDAELEDYLSWRIADSKKNAISSLAVHLWGHSAVLNVNTARRAYMIEAAGAAGMLEGDIFYGTLISRVEKMKETVWTDRDGNEHAARVMRHSWESAPASGDAVAMALDALASAHALECTENNQVG